MFRPSTETEGEKVGYGIAKILGHGWKKGGERRGGEKKKVPSL